MVRFVRCLLVVLGLTLALGVPFVWANAVPVPISIGAHSSVPTGLQSTVTFDARGVGGAANAGYYTRPVLVSNNTLGGLAKGMVRRAAPVAAMTAAITAAGWAIDELTKQVMDGPKPEIPGPVPPGGVYYSYHSQYYSSAAAAEAAVKARMDYPGAPHTSHRYTGGDFANLKAVCQHHEAWSSGQHLSYEYFAEHVNETPFPAPYPWADAIPQPQPVPDAALGELVKDNPALWDQALRNPDGSVNRNPDVMAAAQALAAELANEAGPQPDPTAEWDTGQQGGDPQPGATAQEWPGFCAWASKVCEWIDWTQQEPIYADEDEYQLPIIDPLENAPTWQSGLGNGVCPTPRVVETFVGTISVPFDIFCQLAELLRGLVIAAAYLTAAYILLGVRRG